MSLVSRVSDQNGVSLQYIMLEIHHSGQEPLICACLKYFLVQLSDSIAGAVSLKKNKQQQKNICRYNASVQKIVNN